MTQTQFWLNLLAIIAGPVLAVQAQKWIERHREDQNRKLWLFRELMATRGTRLSPRHVDALNLVELEYSPNKPKQRPVHEAWRSYFDVLNTAPPDAGNPQPHYQRRDDALVELLYEMGVSLRVHHIDRVAIRRNAYTPSGHGDVERELNIIRKSLAKIFTTGQHAIRVQMVDADGADLPPVMTEQELYRPIRLQRGE